MDWSLVIILASIIAVMILVIFFFSKKINKEEEVKEAEVEEGTEKDTETGEEEK